MMKANWIKGLVIFAWILGSFLLSLQSDQEARSADNENYCFTCHTNARKLIEITRELKKEQKGKPGASTETVGEG
jgi:nitrate/TMAO reductase-like tetraheme cytochrome c subunit